jgi:predicted transcriptional regulator
MPDSLVEAKPLPTAAEVIRSITPPVLATLVVLRGANRKTQEEIASEVGCARSTVSKYFRTLENLPLSVIDKQGHSVVVTEHGESLIEIYQSVLSEFGIELESVDWAADEISVVEDALSPLYKFRSETPFLVLAGLVDLSTEAQHEIWIDDLIIRMENIDRETINSVSKQHFEQILDNFEQHETIQRDKEEIELTEKGQHQGALLRKVTFDILDERDTIENSQTDSGVSTSDLSSTVSPQTSPKTGTGSELIAEPDAANAFQGGSYQGTVGAAEIGPVVCVDSGDGLRSIGAIRGEETETLAENLRAIASELEEMEDASGQPLSAGIYRSLVYDDGIFPLGDDWQSLETASFAEWQMINKAFRLIDQQDP